MAKIPNNAVLCMPFNNDLNDLCGNTFTIVGNPTLSSTQSVFGTNSLYLDGSSLLYMDGTNDFDFGTNDFTISWWEYRTSGNAGTSIFSTRDNYVASNINGVVAGWIQSGIESALVAQGGNWAVFPGALGSFGAPVINTWTHLAFTRSGNVWRLFRDGVLVTEVNADVSISTANPFMVTIGCTGNSNFIGYINNLLVVNGEALYTENFTPPTDYLKLPSYAYLSSNNLYTGTSLTNLTTNWSGLTSTEKEALVESFSDEIPSIQDLASISPFRVLTNSASLENVKVTGQPKPQIIEPTSLINTGAVSTVQSINITNIITDVTVKFVITTDLTTYKVYDAIQGDWITSTNIEEDGMSIAQINALTPEILALLDVSNGIAFKQCFIATSENASAEVSEISAVVDIDGSWSQSVHGTDYSVAYPNKTTMSVRLLTNGDYIINYPISSNS